jgi:hypothetical protein
MANFNMLEINTLEHLWSKLNLLFQMSLLSITDQKQSPNGLLLHLGFPNKEVMDLMACNLFDSQVVNLLHESKDWAKFEHQLAQSPPNHS